MSGLNDHGRTVVLTTHYMDEAELLCDRVAIMDRGKILGLDVPAALIRGLDAGVRTSLETGTITPDDARALPGVENVETDETSVLLATHEPAGVLAALAARDAPACRSRLLPLRYLNDGMLGVMVRGEGPGAVLLPIGILLAFGAVVMLIAGRLFRWETD